MTVLRIFVLFQHVLNQQQSFCVCDFLEHVLLHMEVSIQIGFSNAAV